MTLYKKIAMVCICFGTVFTQNYIVPKTELATEPDMGPVRDLNVMTFLPMTGTTYPAGRALLPALNLATRAVNSRADILPGFKLNPIIQDCKCDVVSGVTRMFELLYTAPVKLMIMGPVCSVTAEAQAEVSYVWNISHITYGASSLVLRDKTRFPRFFRLLPSDSVTNLGKIAVLKYFNWRKVATLTISTDLFSATTYDLVQKLKEEGVEIISQEIYNNDPTLRVQNLKQKDARIIFSASYEPMGRLVLCAAYRSGLYGPKVVWVFPGWFNPYWWRIGLEHVPCSQTEMDNAAEGHLLATIYYNNPNEEKSIGGITAGEFAALRMREPTFVPEAEPFALLAPFVYDSVWGSALALNCTAKTMKERGDWATSYINIIYALSPGYKKTLDQFDYSDGDIGNIITACLANLSFMGVSGAVKFDETREPLKNIRIEQVQDLEMKTVGRYVLEEEDRYLEWFDNGIYWPGGVVPRDSTQVSMVEQSIPLSLYIPMSVTATLGNILAVSLLAFNIIYRNHAYVKLSSPNINNVLVCGCILTYSSVYMYSSQYTSPLLCKLRHFIFTTGFTMAFGAMFAKTWRVYKIFCNKNLLRVKINDLQLIVIVIVMVVIMFLVLVIWEAVDSLIIRTLNLEHMAYSTGTDAIAIPVVLTCTSTYYYYFLCTMCIMEGAMLAFGAFLSFETRKVRIEALNDARQIGLCLYNVIILSGLVLILSILLDNQIALVYGIFSGFVILGTTTTLLVIFIPKIQSVYYPTTVGPAESPHNMVGRLNRTVEQKSLHLSSCSRSIEQGTLATEQSTTK